MARPHIEPFVDRTVPFKKMTLPGFPKGMHYKMLSLDTDTGACSMTVMFEPGYELPPGMSYTEMELFVMTGYIEMEGRKHGPGTYICLPAGVSLPAMRMPRGITGLLFYNHGEPSFVESDQDHPLAEREKLIRVNAYDDMQWSSTNFFPATAPGCLVKILKFDERTQAFTFLYCMTPNFWQDNISYHDCAEEAYHIWGTSWMMQFGELPTGGYFWRPPYINHGAFQCKLGTLAIGRTDSQLYNHFHFNPWTTLEENRERAGARMLAWKPDLYRWVATGAHNHPADFEFPHAHYDEKGERIWHHHEGGDLDHGHGRAGPARKSRGRK
jgi:Domain of unknown function (DUF4437)